MNCETFVYVLHFIRVFFSVNIFFLYYWVRFQTLFTNKNNNIIMLRLENYDENPWLMRYFHGYDSYNFVFGWCCSFYSMHLLCIFNRLVCVVYNGVIIIIGVINEQCLYVCKWKNMFEIYWNILKSYWNEGEQLIYSSFLFIIFIKFIFNFQ